MVIKVLLEGVKELWKLTGEETAGSSMRGLAVTRVRTWEEVEARKGLRGVDQAFGEKLEDGESTEEKAEVGEDMQVAEVTKVEATNAVAEAASEGTVAELAEGMMVEALSTLLTEALVEE